MSALFLKVWNISSLHNSDVFSCSVFPPLKVQLNPTVLLLMTWILGSRLFQCQLCSRGFTGKAQLLSHFKNVHSEQIGAFSWISVRLLHFFQNSLVFFYERWLFLGLLDGSAETSNNCELSTLVVRLYRTADFLSNN